MQKAKKLCECSYYLPKRLKCLNEFGIDYLDPQAKFSHNPSNCPAIVSDPKHYMDAKAAGVWSRNINPAKY